LVYFCTAAAAVAAAAAATAAAAGAVAAVVVVVAVVVVDHTFLRVLIFKNMFIKQPICDKSSLPKSIDTSTLFVYNEVNYGVFILCIIL
jgi:hypothetical protein